MLKATASKHTLEFKQPSGTSRGVLTEKDSWIIRVFDDEHPEIVGRGEASIIKTLSPEWNEDYVTKLDAVLERIDSLTDRDMNDLKSAPSILFALECALADLKNGGNGRLFESDFTEQEAPIPINGLIWMGSEEFMLKQIEEKLERGFRCIKMKIGAIDFHTEMELLRSIRRRFDASSVELRVDANGAFEMSDVMGKLDLLAALQIHSIEQPIKAGQYDEMKALCANTPLPIALDEELIGIKNPREKQHLLDYLKPQCIILKPSLHGGLKGSDEWIAAAHNLNIQWWITSALESNIGLDAIAQYTYTKNNPLPQGLGTGQLFTNNFESPLVIESGQLIRKK